MPNNDVIAPRMSAITKQIESGGTSFYDLFSTLRDFKQRAESKFTAFEPSFRPSSSYNFDFFPAPKTLFMTVISELLSIGVFCCRSIVQ